MSKNSGKKRNQRSHRKARRVQPAAVPPTVPLPGGANGESPGQGDQLFPDPMQLIRCALRRWVLCLTLGTIVAAAVVASLWYLLPPGDYRATALVRLRAQQPRVLFKTGQDPYRTLRDTQVALINSPLVLNKALDNPQVHQAAREAEAEDPIEWLREHISVRFTGGEVMQLSARHQDAQVAAAIANAVVDAYFSEVVDSERRQRLDQLATLENLVTEYEEKVKQLRRSLKDLVNRLGTADSEIVRMEMRAIASHISRLFEQLMATEVQQTEVSMKLQRLEAQQGQDDLEVPESVLEQLVEADPAIQARQHKIAFLREQLEEMESVFKDPNHPRLAALREQIAEEEKALEKAREEARPRLIALAREHARRQLLNEIADVQEQLADLEARRQAIQRDLDIKRSHLKSLDQDAGELEFLRKELEKAEQVHDRALDELTKLRVEAKAPPRAEVIVRATPPRTRDNSRKIKVVGLAGVASFGLVVLSIAFLEWRRGAVVVPNDIEKETNLPVIATVPKLPRAGARANGDVDSTLRQFEEAFDGVRTALLVGRNGDAPRVIMITSPESREGKTTLSAHLAASVARTGARVVSVDLDLRNPSLHQLFDLPVEPGVSDVVCGAVKLEEALHVTLHENLHVLPAGSPVRGISSLIASGRVGQLVRRLRQHYDIVILDVPPVLPVSDALEIGQYADAAVLTALQGGTKAMALQMARRRLDMVNIRLLGVVMLGVTPRGYSRYYGYGYGYGYGRYGAPERMDSEVSTD